MPPRKIIIIEMNNHLDKISPDKKAKLALNKSKLAVSING